MKKSELFETLKANRFALLIFLISILGFALRIYDISVYRPVEEDTGLHSYVVYEFLNNKSMFYRDIWSPQSQTPISFILKGISVSLFGYNQLGIRFVSVILGTLTIPLVYFSAKKLYNKSVGLVASLIFAIDLPYVVEISRWGYDISYLAPFVTLGIYFFASFYKDATSKNLKIMLSGFFLGTASMMKLYALPVIGAVLLVLFFESFRSKRNRLQLRYFSVQFAYFLLGIMIIPLITLAFVFSIGAWNQYLFTLENGRLIALNFDEKIGRFNSFVDRLLPTLLLCIPQIPLAFYYRKAEKLIPILWLIIPIVAMFLVPNFIDSTFYYVSPAIMILASATLVAAVGRIRHGFRLNSSKKHKLVNGLIVIALLALLVQSIYNYQQWAGFLYSDNSQVEGQAEVANFIRANTRSSDLIFTTDVSLAVLSQRSVVKVGAIKVAGFYSDLFGYDGSKYVGIPGHPQGIITPLDVLEAIQTQRPKLVILTKGGSGTFVAVDQIIFNGDPKWNTEGIGPWLEMNYVFLNHIDNAYGAFDVWAVGNPKTLVFADFEGSNYSSTGKLLTIETLGKKTSYSFSQGKNQSTYGSFVKINYTLSGGEHSFVRLGVKSQQLIDMSSFKSIDVGIKGDETSNVVWVDVMDSNYNVVGNFAGSLNSAGSINFVIPLSQISGVNLSKIAEIRISIDNNSQPHDVNGEVSIYKIMLGG